MLNIALVTSALFVASTYAAVGTLVSLPASTFVTSHNTNRAHYQAAALTEITDAAFQQSTNDWATGCQWMHSSGGGYGENLAYAGSSGVLNPDFDLQAMNPWMSEAPAYYADKSLNNFPNYGHFTQVVWKSTTQVFCAAARCPAGTVDANFASIYYVCRYTPPGNYVGQFDQNVGTYQATASQRARSRRATYKTNFAVDTMTSLFSCGEQELDCSMIEHAEEVACVQGQCIVKSCSEGSVAEDGSACI